MVRKEWKGGLGAFDGWGGRVSVSVDNIKTFCMIKKGRCIMDPNVLDIFQKLSKVIFKTFPYFEGIQY